MKLERALSLAEKIKARLQPLCERCEIAGSIRRRRDWVNDIDLVILPHPGQRNEITAQIHQGCAVVTEGEQNCIYRIPLHPTGDDIQLDIFFARPRAACLFGTEPGNFGSLLLCRTGSKEHNIFLIQHAKRRGLVWKPYAGVFDGEKCLAAETEGEIFDALGLEFVDPEKRER